MNDRTERLDFRATSDPALHESADRGELKLLTYRELYLLWERQQWAVQDIDFTQDRIDWHERIPEEERFQRMYGLSSFFIGEQRVAQELGPMMRAAPTEEQRIFLCTQIADEARHVAFFNAFYEQVGVLESGDLQSRLEETSQHLNENFEQLFDEIAVTFKEDWAILEEQQVSLDRYPDRNYVDIASDGARTHSRKVIERRIAEEAAESKAPEPAMA